MNKDILINKLEHIVEKCDGTPEFESGDDIAGYNICNALTEVREDVDDIINELGKS